MVIWTFIILESIDQMKGLMMGSKIATYFGSRYWGKVTDLFTILNNYQMGSFGLDNISLQSSEIGYRFELIKEYHHKTAKTLLLATKQ